MIRRVSFSGPAGELSALVRGEPRVGPTVLFVHPANLSAACWAAVIDGLGEEIACVAPDLRGHGRSDRGGPFGVAEWVADCQAAAEATGCTSLHLVGGSVGATVAAELALGSASRALSLTCVAGAYLPAPAEGDELLALLPKRGLDDELAASVAESALAPGAPAELAARVVADVSRNDAGTAAAIWRGALLTDLSERAATLALPCRVLGGALDQICPPSEAEWFAAQVGAAPELLGGVGHLPQYERPEAVITAIEEQARSAV